MKKTAFYIAAVLMTFASAIPAQAGQWTQSEYHTWQYECQDKTTLKSGWYWIDTDLDKIAECYYFSPDGSMYADARTPDGYTVDSQGRWIVEGAVQTKDISGDSGKGDFQAAVLQGDRLTNSWSGYSLVIPSGTNIRNLAYEGQNARRESCLYDIDLLVPEEKGGFSFFIWYEEDKEPGLSVEGQLKKHQQQLVEVYGYQSDLPVQTCTLGGYTWARTESVLRGQKNCQLMRRVDGRLQRIGMSWKDTPEHAKKAEEFLTGIGGI